MSLMTAKEYLKAYKEDTEAQYINICNFLELLVDFEQSNLEEITTYLNLSLFSSTTVMYKKNLGYISSKGDDKNECETTQIFLNDIAKTSDFCIIMGFPYSTREKYKDYYFSLLEIFQSQALQQISFKEKYAAHEAMGKGFCYISQGSIGSVFRLGDLVSGLPQQRIDEIISCNQIVKVEVNNKIRLQDVDGIQKQAMIKIYEYLDAQEKAYNSTSTHSDALARFFENMQTSNILVDKETDNLVKHEYPLTLTPIQKYTLEMQNIVFPLAEKIWSYDKGTNLLMRKQVAKLIVDLLPHLELRMDQVNKWLKDSYPVPQAIIDRCARNDYGNKKHETIEREKIKNKIYVELSNGNSNYL
ncbi:hypothetical protein [Psychrobacter sp. ANT_WB68]|uniref:hypothetical protein n=1 Tax=Psychrobacter sp. ANT_WB68 TaxID=2597355 RepID=UPI0011F3D21F|nr:hypothetical protein [Psychrobacter sp. ANT_WB68]KAA0914297.1 hypothetical protein FQ084_06910 [Psychrobacter sp. ANT_WB68]